MSRVQRTHEPAPLPATLAEPRPAVGQGRRLYLAAVVVGSAAAGWLLGADPGADAGDPQLAVLIRFMVAIKLAVALAAAVLVERRLRRPAPGPLAMGYIAAIGCCVAGPALLWQLTGVGAGVFYLGLVALLVLASRDQHAFVLSRKI